MTFLQITWFLLIGILLIGYAILDGFDLGVGIWHLFTKKDRDRRIFLNAIGPVWDGNEVWLLTGGGAIFAAFPMVYATVFSGFYLALMLVLFGLIFRAVSLEFRSKLEDEKWRRKWDIAFSVGSMVPALLYGVAIGNLMRGIPLDSAGQYTGSFFTLLNPYALIIGLLGFAMFATQGALYLVLKTEDELNETVRGWAQLAWKAYVALFVLATTVTWVFQSQLINNFLARPVLWLIPAVTAGSLFLIWYFSVKAKDKSAFVASSISIAGLMGMVGAGIFPNLVPAINKPEWSLTIANSSSQLTLWVMLVIALFGMPVVVGYTIFVYRIFKGKVDLEKSIY
ncbi:cytochrome d ubiquinol oxidase subunit II [candidate division CSSED10-310 bacterium]|uniref:Cytochrome d ubiquinol oxidase subunit II n=1 Tax=candidate division CSSED10-310 bacterium TaxID=2855610 RepID=A0ABV6Z4H5_UNCC1